MITFLKNNALRFWNGLCNALHTNTETKSNYRLYVLYKVNDVTRN